MGIVCSWSERTLYSLSWKTSGLRYVLQAFPSAALRQRGAEPRGSHSATLFAGGGNSYCRGATSTMRELRNALNDHIRLLSTASGRLPRLPQSSSKEGRTWGCWMKRRSITSRNSANALQKNRTTTSFRSSSHSLISYSNNPNSGATQFAISCLLPLRSPLGPMPE